MSLYHTHFADNCPPPEDTLSTLSELYAQPDLSDTVWPEEKLPFVQSNSQYDCREAQFMRFPGEPADLCCLGDSITQQLEWQDAFPGLRVVNRGIGSDTTAGILARLDSVAATKARSVSIMAGANDAGKADCTPEGVAENFRAILTELHERLPGAALIVNSMLPTSASHPPRSEDIQAINRELKALCEEMGVVYLDMFSDFADENGDLKQEYSLDGIHLTPAGYALWLSYLGPAVSAALE